MRNGKNILRMQADEEDVYHLMDLRERYFLMIGFGSFIEGIAVYFYYLKFDAGISYTCAWCWLWGLSFF